MFVGEGGEGMSMFFIVCGKAHGGSRGAVQGHVGLEGLYARRLGCFCEGVFCVLCVRVSCFSGCLVLVFIRLCGLVAAAIFVSPIATPINVFLVVSLPGAPPPRSPPRVRLFFTGGQRGSLGCS